MARQAPARPDLPDQLDPLTVELGPLLELEGAAVDRQGADPLACVKVRVEESELRGVALREGVVQELLLRDSRLVGCDASNVRARGATMRRTELIDSRLVGFTMSEGQMNDVLVRGGTMMLALLDRTKLTDVVFENVNLREASFMDARLESVVFDGCALAGADFRGARLKGCSIRGTSLEGIVGVESMRGVRMPWGDIVESSAALAAALGIEPESA